VLGMAVGFFGILSHNYDECKFFTQKEKIKVDFVFLVKQKGMC